MARVAQDRWSSIDFTSGEPAAAYETLGDEYLHTLMTSDVAGGSSAHGDGCECADCSAEDERDSVETAVFGSAVRGRLDDDDDGVIAVDAIQDLTLAQLIQLIKAIIDRFNPPDTFVSGLGDNGVISNFNIEIVFEGNNWTTALQEDFIKASEYLSSIITGDLPDLVIGSSAIDDVKITAELVDIDGSGGVLGQAGPTSVRTNGGLTAQGIMEFDVADSADFDAIGLFDDIVLHEMMHVLGLGTLWSSFGLTEGSQFNDTLRFTGTNANIAYAAEFPDIFEDNPDGIPIETDGGPGTAGGHWDDETFTNELMTGFISDPNYVSNMTVASFEDLGYDTVFDASDPTATLIQPDDIIIA